VQNWDTILKSAKDCHTKQTWEELFELHSKDIESVTHSKPIQDIFKLLENDSQSLQYDPAIFGSLIKGCLSSWNLLLGRKISEFADKIPSVQISLPASQVYLEDGQPSTARSLANRALRLSGLKATEKLQLEIVICSSYAEENKHTKAIKILNKIGADVKNPDLHAKEKADFLLRMGRMHFFLGNYLEAAKLFYDASVPFRELQEWEAVARTIFNTAAAHMNSGLGETEAFAYVEEARRLAEEYDLPGPLSHCEAFYGTNAYQYGNFAGAKEHFRKALDFLPISDKSYRRLHILSMLSLTYLAMGRFHLAKKFGRQTIDLASLDNSQRNRTRYTTLEAEILWEDGLVEESQKLLSDSASNFETTGVHTLEELSALTRFNLQSAFLNNSKPLTKIKIEPQLMNNKSNWFDRDYSLGHLLINQNNTSQAGSLFSTLTSDARSAGYRLHEAQGLLGQIIVLLKQRCPNEIDSLIKEFEIAIGRLGETPLKTHVGFVKAAKDYQNGDFESFERRLRSTAKYSRQCSFDKFCLNAAISTIEGKSSRLTSQWQIDAMARFSSTYFSPTIEQIDDRLFKVSGHYIVSLERHPALADLLTYLINRNNFSATSEDIQQEVWGQSLKAQGWQQKIRNTIMRLRDFFPNTIAPLILHTDQVALFGDAIQIIAPMNDEIKPEDEVGRLLKDGPMTTAQLSNRMQISSSTTKRILKRLVENNQIKQQKQGRNVFYTPNSEIHI